MSLVNDALQRAKQHTAQPAPSPNLQLRPVEPAARPAPHPIWKYPMVLSIIAIVALALVVTGWFQRGKDSGPRANPAAIVVPMGEAKPSNIAAATPPATPKISEPPAAAESKIEVVNTTPAPPVAMIQPPTPRPVPPKLQAIFFNKTQPTAMISGKTVQVGTRLGEFQIAAISPNSATLVNGTTTNILSFQE